MKGDSLPHEHHVLRYVGARFVDRDGDRVTIFGNAFLSVPKDDNSPSYNWLELLDSDRTTAVAKARSASRLKYGAKALLAVLNVGAAIRAARVVLPDNDIDMVHDPLDAEAPFLADPSHSLMTNIPEIEDPGSDALADALEICVLESHPARS